MKINKFLSISNLIVLSLTAWFSCEAAQPDQAAPQKKADYMQAYAQQKDDLADLSEQLRQANENNQKATEVHKNVQQKLHADIQDLNTKFNQTTENHTQLNQDHKNLKDQFKQEQNASAEKDQKINILKERTAPQMNSKFGFNSQMPDGMVDAYAKVADAEANNINYQNSYKKMGADFFSGAMIHVGAPIIVAQANPALTALRHKHGFITKIEALNNEIVELSKKDKELDIDLKTQSKAISADTKTHNQKMAKLQEEGQIINNYATACANGSINKEEEMDIMVESILKFRVANMYKDTFGHDYQPTKTPAKK
jgi:chromosome segregation ATPase